MLEESANVADIVFPHAQNVLKSLQHRFQNGQMYTIAGDLLIMLNSFCEVVARNQGIEKDSAWWIHDFRAMCQYSKSRNEALNAMGRATNEESLQVHAYGVAENLYRRVASNLRSECLLIDGESASGKTELLKRVVEYFVNMKCSEPPPSSENQSWGASVPHREDIPLELTACPLGSSAMPFVSRRGTSSSCFLLEANVLLEAFGHAKTLANRNSSRVGKYVKLYVHPSDGKLCGGSIMPLMFESTRVTHFAERTERNFHVFYQLLRGVTQDEAHALSLRAKLKDLKYLRCAKPDLEDMDDGVEMQRTIKALHAFGFTPTEVFEVKRLLAAILNMGELRFTGVQATLSNATLSADRVSTVENLLGLEPSTLPHVLLYCTLSVSGHVKFSPRTADEAICVVEVLARSLYHRLFNHVVRCINRCIVRSAGSRYVEALANVQGRDASAIEPRFVGLVDIFGFEGTAKNGIQSFFVNYASEKLHALFVKSTFNDEVSLYQTEGLAKEEYPDVHFQDNTEIIDILEHQAHGMLPMLEEASNWERSNDATFLAKMLVTYQTSKLFERGTKQREHTSFVVHHSAAHVMYEVDGFVSRNRERVAADVLSVLGNSSMPIMHAMFQQDHAKLALQRDIDAAPSEEEAGTDYLSIGALRDRTSVQELRAAAKLPNIARRSISEMKNIAAELSKIRLTFVRCLRPNLHSTRRFFEPAFVHRQLEYSNILSKIAIYQHGFTEATKYNNFYERFILVPRIEAPLVLKPGPGADVKHLTRQLFKELLNLAFPGVLIEDVARFGKSLLFTRHSVLRALEVLRSEKLESMDKASVLLQSVWRMAKERHEFVTLVEGMTRAQSTFRGNKDFRNYVDLRSACIIIVTRFKIHLHRIRSTKERRATLTLQRWSKRAIHTRKWTRLRRAVYSMHMLGRGFLIREHVNHMIIALKTLQRAARRLIKKLSIIRHKSWLALRIQAWFRGQATRAEYAEKVDQLMRTRFERHCIALVVRVQRCWRTLMVRTRFLHIIKASRTIQRWSASRLLKFCFQTKVRAAVTFQSLLRGMRARHVAREMVVRTMIADEKDRHRLCREREVLQIAKVCGGIDASSNTKVRAGGGLGALSSSKTSLFVVTEVDMMVDASDIYLDGWASTFSGLEQALTNRLQRVVSLAVGASHTAIVTDAGDVYTWGWGDHGQLGHGSFRNEQQPRLLDTLFYKAVSYTGRDANLRSNRSRAAETVKIKEIAAGDDFTAALSEVGRVYTWGSGRKGQLGNGIFRNCAYPQLVEGVKRKVAQIACGSHSTCCVGDPGTVYAWGIEAMLGQGKAFVGHGDQATPLVVPIIRHGAPTGENYSQRICQVSCGRSHTLALSQLGQLYAWGRNSFGQLGVGDREDRLKPALCAMSESTVPSASPISAVSCGARHSMACSPTRLLVWGANKFGQLGLGDVEDRLQPTELSYLERQQAIQVAGGWRQSMVLTSKNELFTWGHTSAVSEDSVDFRRADDRTSAVTLTPKIVPMSSDRCIERMQCAWSHTLSATGVTLKSGNFLNQSGASSNFGRSRSELLSHVQNTMSDTSTKTLREVDFSTVSILTSQARRVSRLLTSEKIRKMDLGELKAVLDIIPRSTSKRITREARERFSMLNTRKLRNAGKSNAASSRSRAVTITSAQSAAEVIEKERGWNANHTSRRNTATFSPSVDLKTSFRSQLTSFGSTKGSIGRLGTSLGVMLQLESNEQVPARLRSAKKENRSGPSVAMGQENGATLAELFSPQHVSAAMSDRRRDRKSTPSEGKPVIGSVPSQSPGGPPPQQLEEGRGEGAGKSFFGLFVDK